MIWQSAIQDVIAPRLSGTVLATLVKEDGLGGVLRFLSTLSMSHL